MNDDFFIEPDYPAPIYSLYDLYWRTWFDSLNDYIQNPRPVGDETDKREEK